MKKIGQHPKRCMNFSNLNTRIAKIFQTFQMLIS